MNNIKDKLRKWVKLDEEIHILQKKLNKLRKKKGNLTPDIINFMELNNKNNIYINSNYKLQLKSRTQYTAVSKKHINDTLKNKINTDTIKQIIDIIYTNRQKKIINNLEIKKK
jgi:hypothetical protein